MSRTGWTRTPPPKPEWRAADVGITAAALEAAASDVPVNSYADAAKRAAVAQQHANKEVKTMLSVRLEDLEVVAPKAERCEEARLEKGKRKPAAAPVLAPTDEVAPGGAVGAGASVEDLHARCLHALTTLATELDEGVAEYLANAWVESEDPEESREVVCETLAAHGIGEALTNLILGRLQYISSS
mmetsp:Transcript_98449/g.228289  ORF Transcript_98449/g.228289 Transcript_98449/m.228289 type:complete len:186 (-) Transcript_98449:139-696(-)